MLERELGDLGELVADEAWPQALEAALALWRAHRWWQLADLIDELGARCPPLDEPPVKLHRWWIERALVYDAARVTPLLALFRKRGAASSVSWQTILARGGPLASRLAPAVGALQRPFGEWLDLTDRLALVLQWPDDPRVGQLLATVVHERPFAPTGWRVRESFVGAVASIVATFERLVEIGDLRTASQTLALVWRHRSTYDGRTLPGLQPTKLYERTTLITAPPPAVRASLEALVARWRPPRSPRIEALWEDASARPDELALRLVLADALIEAGDPRGELIAVQCAPRAALERGEDAAAVHRLRGIAGHRSEELLARHRSEWLGELALVVADHRFHEGLLAWIAVGLRHAPPWAYAAAARHRELAGIQRITPADVVEPALYVDFVLALRRPPVWLGIDAAIARVFGSRGRSVAVRCIQIADDPSGANEAFEIFSHLAPQISQVQIGVAYDERGDPVQVAQDARARFRTLERVLIRSPYRPLTEGEIARLRALPYVVVPADLVPSEE